MIYTAILSEDIYSAAVVEDIYDANLGDAVNVSVVPGKHYGGDTVITPSNEPQTLMTAGFVVDRNITVNPIPSNYGLITWDGNILTVS